MTINFQPDICLPKDPEGFGRWLNGHYLEHLQIRNILLGVTPPINVPDYNLLFWDDQKEVVQAWLYAHETIHQEIETALNITGVDFSQVDLTKEDEWYEWMDNHATEHQLIRQLLGMK